MFTLSRKQIAVCLLPLLVAAPLLAWAQSAPSTGDIQIFRNARESVAVFSRIAPVDKGGALVAPDDPALQLKQSLENLRLLAARLGVSPIHFVTLTLFVKERSGGEELQRVAQETFRDWNPATTIVEAKELRVAGALVEVEGVAVVRGLKSRR